MARVRVELPSVLGDILQGKRLLEVEGATLAEALEDLVRRCPALRVHLFDEAGAFRQHVLCLHNGTNTRWFAGLDRPVAEGDTLTILQAVSGG
ncbi:MAG: MoaD/ThiS family protein [Planctomycetes bacterium]|nr:MoaD/ThiS family protein [Planctomycetota bacterium]